MQGLESVDEEARYHLKMFQTLHLSLHLTLVHSSLDFLMLHIENYSNNIHII